MRPMSWYSGSHETPSCGASGVSGGISAFRVSVWASTARCESATGLGATVLPDENCTRARSSGSTSRWIGTASMAWSDSTVRSPSRGRASRHRLAEEPTHPAVGEKRHRAGDLEHPRGAARGTRPAVRAGPADRAGPAPRPRASDAEERVHELRTGGKHQRHPLARAHSQRHQRARHPAARARTSTQPSAFSDSSADTKVSPRAPEAAADAPAPSSGCGDAPAAAVRRGAGPASLRHLGRPRAPPAAPGRPPCARPRRRPRSASPGSGSPAPPRAR